MAKRTSVASSSLDVLNAKIDRKKLSLRQQTLKAEAMSKKRGIPRNAAMIAVARNQVASQAEAPASTRGRRKSFTPSGPPTRSPFGSGTRKPTGKGVTRRGGRQPAKKVKKVTVVSAEERDKKKKKR